MAKLKLEWLGHYWSRKHPPFRDRFFGRMGQTTRKLDKLPAWLVNLASGSRVGRSMLSATLGLAPERSLPPLAKRSLFRLHTPREETSDRAKVLLFADTFNCYYEPEIGHAAVLLLERLGYDVLLIDHGCCGRTSMSKGFVDGAKAAAMKVVDNVYEFARSGIPIVGLEPSCILSLRDEYRVLLPDDPRTETVAQTALTLEEFIAREAQAEKLNVSWKTQTQHLVVHGHCHQKALAGMESAVATLSLPGHTVSVIDSGCCGMAGSFGYEREHYAWSIKMAERVLAPAVRGADASDVIVAAGTSCRAQIEHCTGRRALHPAQVLLNSLE
jgi:Fe-S oxidoreductase